MENDFATPFFVYATPLQVAKYTCKGVALTKKGVAKSAAFHIWFIEFPIRQFMQPLRIESINDPLNCIEQ